MLHNGDNSGFRRGPSTLLLTSQPVKPQLLIRCSALQRNSLHNFESTEMVTCSPFENSRVILIFLSGADFIEVPGHKTVYELGNIGVAIF